MKNNDEQLLKGIDPVRNVRLDEGTIEEAGDEMLAAIMAGAKSESGQPGLERRAGARRRGFRLAAGGGAIALAAVVAFALIPSGGSSPTLPQSWAAQVVEVVEKSPRVMLPAPEWELGYVNEFSSESGMSTYNSDNLVVDFEWIEADKNDWSFKEYEQVAKVDIAGNKAKVFAYPTDPVFITTWIQGEHRLRASVGPAGNTAPPLTLAEVTDVLSEVEIVDVANWIEALPPRFLRPDQVDEEATAILAQLPIPPGMDTGPGAIEPLVGDRYQLGARIVGAVSCEWISRWIEARSDGNDDVADEAVEAMSTARDWPILREMEAAGGMSSVVYQFADAIAGDGTVTMGSLFSVGDAYRNALCMGPGDEAL